MAAISMQTSADISQNGVGCTFSSVMRRGPHCRAAEINSEALEADFHEMFRLGTEQNRKKIEKKIKKKVKMKTKDKKRLKNEAADVPLQQPPYLAIKSNPSSFAIFSSVRQCVLEKQMYEAACLYLGTFGGRLSDSETEDEEDKIKDSINKIPKIVGIGLCSVFELIRESQRKHPGLCVRALQALLDMLQGQQPEGLKSEPPEVIDSLFYLLLDISSSPQSLPEQPHTSSVPSLTAYACACLLSLVIARGDTGKLLNASSAMLMSPRVLAAEEIPTPGIMTSLQRSVHAVLLGKTVRPSWLTHGFPKNSLCHSFIVQIPKSKYKYGTSVTSDGKYIYILSSGTIYKVGSGYGGTVKGQIVMSRGGIKIEDKGWLGYSKGYLYFHPLSGSIRELIKIDRETLKEKEHIELDVTDCGPSAYFSDGDNLGLITASKDDSFLVRTYKPSVSPMPCIHELTLKLARKCLDVYGSGIFEEEATFHTVNLGCEDEPASVVCGKDFALVKSVSGKIFFTGKSQSLGIKQGGPTTGKWAELPITKSPKIVHYSVGHDGLHAILVAEDGGVFFVGLARRGEDGDQSKGRRQPKPVKPKKMIKMEGHYVVSTACNNGTSALVTRDGELYLFGKDNTYSDHNTGLVADLKEVIITQVALGKAHIVALSNKGHIYTFGINHKGQCGRDFPHGSMKEVHLPVAMATAPEEDGEDEELELEDTDVKCQPGKHRWKHDQCMVCTLCGECTGYGANCVASSRPERNSGLANIFSPCGCGAGDSGCAECGWCRTCARKNDQDIDISESRGPVIGGRLFKQSDIIVFDPLYGGRVEADFENRLRRSFEEYKIRHRRRQMLQSLKAMKSGHLGVRNSLRSEMQDKEGSPAVEDSVGSDHEREATKLTTLPPARLYMPAESPVVQVACGMHHTILLLQNGEVYTFGSNQYGQLGLGDFIVRGTPSLVKLPVPVNQVAAGSYHSVLLTSQGQIYTWGSYQKGQLGRTPPNISSEEKRERIREKESLWHAIPGMIPNIGAKHGRRATWAGASGDQTFVKIDESLINSHNLTKSSVVASKTCIGIIPNATEQVSSFRCLVVNKVDGTCRSFTSSDQLELKDSAMCLDSTYNNLWNFNPSTQRVSRFNIIATEMRSLSGMASFPSPSSSTSSSTVTKETVNSLPHILSPELSIPTQSATLISRSHAALYILGCLDTLTAALEQNLQVQNDERSKQNMTKVYSKEDFAIVNRFESHGGGWGYSGHSIEAIRFMADTDILLGGFGLFGGRGEYTAKLKLFDIGIEGGDQETDGELISETEEIPYECGARQKYPMLFDEPITIQANRWHVAWARISGPSSDCGSSGQSIVTTEDQVIFYFKSSKKSNNGTDVNAGQIPQLLYRVITPDNQLTLRPPDQTEPIRILSKEFSKTVTPDCFHSLLKLLKWAWQSFKVGLCETVQGTAAPAVAALLDLERLVYICSSGLNLLRIYINEVYPNSPISKKIPQETSKLADCVADTRALLHHILSDHLPLTALDANESALSSSSTLLNKYVTTILDACHQTFLSCYHSFYPSAQLKWRGLCDLLLTVDVPWAEEIAEADHLLAAVLASLCGPTIRLTSTLPILVDQDLFAEATSPNLVGLDSSPIPGNGQTQEMSPCLGNGEIHHYPLLVECMNMRTEREGCHPGPCSFKEVLDHLLAIVVHPVKSLLRQEQHHYSSKLITNACALLSVIVAELSYQTAGSVLDFHGSSGQVLHITPSRFTRVSQNRTWNTGNGSPDAVCFSVDRPGILIAGVCVYGGVGNEWHYELELLDDSCSSSDPSHTQRWKMLAIIRGTFGPEDCYGDLAELKFEHPVQIKENVKYAIRLRNHGARTNNGDGGLAQVKGPDGAIFTFSDCSLSFNGTNHTRGQIPQILYYSTPLDSESFPNTRDLAELQARKNSLGICSSIVRFSADLLLEAQSEADEKVLFGINSSHLVTLLLPLILAHLGPVATTDPRTAVQVLGMVQELLPLVSALNKRGIKSHCSSGKTADTDIKDHVDSALSTTSCHYGIVESDHPYRPASVSNYKVTFPSVVRWLSLEFDSQCGTSQVEDSLQLYIPCKEAMRGSRLPPGQIFNITGSQEEEEEDYTPYWPVLRKFSGNSDWPNTALVLPGNEVVFSLETASDYVKDEKANFFGFRCQVVGFECPQLDGPGVGSWEGLRHLERELAYLGGMCAASLMRRDLLLPPISIGEIEDDMDIIEDLAQQVYNCHSVLLSKGFALAHPPTIHQALEGILPFSNQSNERSFLKDFVSCTQGTSGGRLARWLQPESYVEPKQCELLCSQEELKCGWPAVITVITKDQYGKIVQVPNLKVEVKAVPMNVFDKESGCNDPSRKVPRVSKPETGLMTFGGQMPPNLDVPYEITVKDKMFYYAITVMKAYENYSFEELRYVSPTKKRLIENMLVRTNNDGTYTANWTPGSIGWYLLRVIIDGSDIGTTQQCSVEVKEPPQGLMLPTKTVSQKTCHQPNKMRKFVAKFSAGLRIRSHPSLQSEQIGIIHINDTISFIDELHNDDGVWVCLSTETIRKYCHNGFSEAWCLQYNQHLGKTLLIPVEEPKSVVTDFFKEKGSLLKKKATDEIIKERTRMKTDHIKDDILICFTQKDASKCLAVDIHGSSGPGVYHVVKCGASGHNIRSRPSLKASPVGMLVLGNSVNIIQDLANSDGIWVKLDKESMQRFCFNLDGEAWSLSQSRTDVVYLQHEAEVMQAGDSDDEKGQAPQFGMEPIVPPVPSFGVSAVNCKGYDFASAVNTPAFGSFAQPAANEISGGQVSNANQEIQCGIFTFGSGTSDHDGGSSGCASPFIFGSPASTPSTSMNTLAESEKTETDRSEKDSLSSGSKVSVLQKWLKEESMLRANTDSFRATLPRDIPPELHGVSVKELVKAIGESRVNGNAATPPNTSPNATPPPHRSSRSASPKSVVPARISSSRSSSPITIPTVKSTGEVPSSAHLVSGTLISSSTSPVTGSPKSLPSRHSSIIQDTWSTSPSSTSPKSAAGMLRRSSLQSDTSVSSHFSSILKELSQTSATGCIGCITQRNTISPISTPGTPGTPATPGTPKKEVCGATPKSVTQTGTQTSPDGSVRGHFSIGAAGGKDVPPKLSPKMTRKDRTTRQLRSKRDRANSPAPVPPDKNSKEKAVVKETVKEAMSPSVAECLRAVFAAFLWHEGLVHDAMACSSFLKFNPTLPKQITKVPQVTFRDKSDSSTLTREQKARYRHSVEVALSSLLNFQCIDTLTPIPLNSNINKNKLRKTSAPIKEDMIITESVKDGELQDDKQSLGATAASPVPTAVPKTKLSDKYQLPQSLQHLVFLWENISSSCLRAIGQQLIVPSPLAGSKMFQRLDKDRGERDKDRKSKKKKDYRPIMSSRGNLFGEAAGGPFVGLDRESMCELCGNFFPHPVTYHMRQTHPGCGEHAGGKGYNSGGNFCGGWAGNCGDGGFGGSNWYLICDRCREKYLRQKRQTIIKEKTKKLRKKTTPSKLLSPLPPMEAHQVMKNNALFLLELSSAASSVLPSKAATPVRYSPYSSMPCVSEQVSIFDNSPFPMSSFQCLEMLGVQQAYNNMIGEEFLSEDDIRALQNGAEGMEFGIGLSDIAQGIMRSITMNGGGDLQQGVIKRERKRSKGRDGEIVTRTFHRSISVGLTSRDWNKQEGDEGRIIITRKRNNSSGSEENGASFLCQPSAALTKLVSLVSDEGNHSEFPLQRPVMMFLLQRHDLESLQLAMKQALRKAACRVYAMQALNWLLRSVTQPTSLHDLLWCFVAALSPVSIERGEEEGEDGAEVIEKKEHEMDRDLGVCEHPLSDITIAGDAAHPLPQTFHALLQTISDIMMLLPMGSSLQQMAMRCWCLKFHPSDHRFLHRSHVFSNISKILSRSEEEGEESAAAAVAEKGQVTAVVEALKDITPLVEIKASSRQAMVNSLTDNSTETFWESGDEDRNKIKILTLICGSKTKARIVYVHIDNCRDLGNKVSTITFRSGSSAEEMKRLKLVDVENRYIGWLSCMIPDTVHNTIKLELKGPDNTLRLRQVKVLGKQGSESLNIGKSLTATQIQQRNCETETLKVFRLLTSQVFGKLISGENEGYLDWTDDFQDTERQSQPQQLLGMETTDLKEHMVGILFSRSKLTHLQKQVCSHIVAAIKKEATRVREEWEALLCSKSQSVDELPKSSDAYCFEMLSMVLALSGSSVGRNYLAQQAGLLKDLFSLLHTGSARVQRQVTSLLRRVLPEVSPPNLANILGVPFLPPIDFSIVSESSKVCQQTDSPFDLHQMGILDVFLACIAKSLTVQTKVKGSNSTSGKVVNTVTLATSIHPRDYVGSRWWLRGCMSRKLSEVIIQLLKDMASNKLTEAWASVTKGAIAENILNLTKLEEQFRSPSECLRTPTLWLALASLCVLDQDHVERLSSGQWVGGTDGHHAQPRPTCDNHDDGETSAIILCSICGNLCADCDRFLHLHRKTRSHQRQVFKEEEEAIKVDLHEGCGRTKLFWVMCLADSKTLKAMVEFREGTRGKTSSSGICRFCGSTGSSGLLAIGNVCSEQECQEYARNACTKLNPCGHMCGGIRNENPCLPCLHGCGGETAGLKQDADDMCMICFTEALSYAPAIQMCCGHVFHLHCSRAVLMKRWAGPRITFAFSLCPICKAPMNHSVLKDLLDPIRSLYEDVKRKALMRLEYEGLHKAEAITTPGARFYGCPAEYSMERYAYYVCYKCKKAYYGGEARCDAEAGQGDDYDPTELVCGACSDVSRAQMCPKHGTDFLEYKCRYCCSVAVFFCFGTTHFCNACHDDFQRVTNIPKNELPHCPAGPKAKQLEGEECPLHVKHPLTGEEFALGCGVCRNAHTF